LALAAATAFALVHGLTVRHTTPAVAAADVLPYAAGTAVLAIAIVAISAMLRRPAWRTADRPVRWLGGGVVLLIAGAITFARGPHFADAEAAWQQTLAVNPDSAVARQELAARFVEQGFLEEAGIQLDRVADRQHDLAWHLARGRVFDAQKRYAEAVRCYETAHSQQLDDVSTTVILAEAYANAGHLPEAAKLYDELLGRITNDATLYTNAGLTQMRLRHPHAAVDLYRTALKLDPKHIPAHVNLANALFELRQMNEAAEHLQTVIAIDPRNFVAFMNAGVMLYRLGDPAKAEQMFRAAVHLDPRSADAYRKLAATLTAQKKDAEAAWCLGQAGRVEGN
jgi:tetratricopeptide (TPR) repeat protein